MKPSSCTVQNLSAHTKKTMDIRELIGHLQVLRDITDAETVCVNGKDIARVVYDSENRHVNIIVSGHTGT